MGKMQYLAHISEDGRRETVRQHLSETAKLAGRFAAAFNAEKQGRLAGAAHDIGKYSSAFQKRLEGDPIRVDHSTAGAAECARICQPFAAISVAGHHGGLPDGGSGTDSADSGTFRGRLKRAQNGLLDSCDTWKKEIKLPSVDLPAYLKGRVSPLAAMFFTRMLYSCLVDSDFLCTEAFMRGEARQKGQITMNALEEKLRIYTEAWYPPKGELNKQRCKILERCIEEGQKEAPGLFTLTVPTGGGKTVSSMAFALAHAKENDLHRIIYVIPYTSIIEQNVGVFREILGEDAVLEHHSGVLFDIDEEGNSENIRMAQATENWDMPVVVTTAVQFFESLFSDRPSKCRKLHNLAKSVIVFDEAQMLPIHMLRPCVYAISQLVAHFGATAVLCTATQPALNPIFREFLPKVTPKEICPQEISGSPVFKRVTFQKVGRLSWEELLDRLNAQRQVLCIVNSRKGAAEVFSRLNGEGCYHLSTLMYPAHREKTLDEIRDRLKSGLPCKVVSTSLIEAGVDVDFPSVYREEAGLDSVLQAAGRCNREGKRKASESVVTVFRAESVPPPIFSVPIAAGREAMENCEDIGSQKTVTKYFENLLDLKGNQAQDRQEILQLMEKEFFPFRKVAERFHVIDSKMRTVYIPLGEGEKLIRRLKNGERSRGLFRGLGKFGVSVYSWQFSELENDGALEVLEDGSAILSDTELYDARCGLAPKADSGAALFI